ncbi:MAG: hypothetical protein HYY01_06495 [Chloroflexi bacterium]|nr:hypothetical protein [Chloroflexota bacterium]
MAIKTDLPKADDPNVQFLKVLRDLAGYKSKTMSDFAHDCGQELPNMSDYLRGKKVPQKKALLGCLQSLTRRRFGYTVQAVCEICPIPDSNSRIPDCAGIYLIYDSAGNALYIGQAQNFRVEVSQTLGRRVPVPIRVGPALAKDKPKIRDLAMYYSLYRVDDKDLRTNLEALLLRTVSNLTYNTNLGHFTSSFEGRD